MKKEYYTKGLDFIFLHHGWPLKDSCRNVFYKLPWSCKALSGVTILSGSKKSCVRLLVLLLGFFARSVTRK